MPAVRTKKHPARILDQLYWSIVKWPNDRPISFPDLLADISRNADIAGIKNAPARLKIYIKGHLASLSHHGFIKVDFREGSLELTVRGQRKCQSILEEIEGTHLDGKEELISCFRAVKRNLGPLKGRTKIELITLNERLQRKLDDQKNTPKLSPDVVQRIGHLPIAGPSHSGRVFLNGTPLRKAPSMGVYASPESLPRQHFPRPAFFRLSPAPSPTFRATSPMDVDDELLLTPTTSGQLDAPMEKPRLEPSELENESQARLVAEKIDLYESNKKLSALLSAAKAGAQESEQDKNKLMDELADCQVYAQSYKDQICLLEAQQDELLGRKDARNQELEEDIDSLRMLHGQATEEISEVKQQIRQLESRLAESESRRNDLEKEKTGFIQRIQHLEAVLQDISLRFVRDSQSLAERVQREIGKG